MLALETKHVMQYLQCNQQQQGATMCLNPASLAQVQFIDYICKDICTYMCSLKRRITRKRGMHLFLVISNSCKSNEASCVRNHHITT